MIIIPREKPVIENLNSYYLNIEKLVEHYQGELGAGVIYFKAPSMECALFFDEYQIVNGYCEEKKKKTSGRPAIDRIVDLASSKNFTVSVYGIRPDRLHFWAYLPNSQVIYSDLTTEFIDLAGLIRKMESKKFTGYIDAQLNGDFKGGLLFFFDGDIIGGLSSRDHVNIDRSSVYRDDLVRHAKEHGGTFNVMRILIDDGTPDSGSGEGDIAIKEKKQSSNPAAERKKTGVSGSASKNRVKKKKSPRSAATAAPSSQSDNILPMLESLLGIMDGLIRNSRKIRHDFETLLNQKFVEKVDKYEFLDPFAAEFRYSEGRISYTGEDDYEVLVKAISECVLEIAESHDLTSHLRKELHPWRQKFANEVVEFDLRL